MEIVNTIIPIFSVIVLGLLANRRGFIPVEFIVPANRLVFYLAIPAMVFRSISKTPLHASFNLQVIMFTLLSIIIIAAAASITGLTARINRKSLGAFIQSSFHGNLGYVGLAVSYYYLGDKGLAVASIIAGFVMILQNVLSTSALQLCVDLGGKRKNNLIILKNISSNPVIISAIAGILFAVFEIHVPVFIGRSLDIISRMALPTALLIIGGTLSFDLIQSKMKIAAPAAVFKLVILPAVGLFFFKSLHMPSEHYLPALILLASPTATITYVLNSEMKGDPDSAAAAISLTTLLSAISFTIWLHIAS